MRSPARAAAAAILFCAALLVMPAGPSAAADDAAPVADARALAEQAEAAAADAQAAADRAREVAAEAQAAAERAQAAAMAARAAAVEARAAIGEEVPASDADAVADGAPASDVDGAGDVVDPVVDAEPASRRQRRPTWSWRPDEGGPIFTFGAATSFVFDINQPDEQATGENRKLYADGRSEESFNIDLVQLGVSGSRGRVSYGAKIDFGDWVSALDDDLDGDVGLQEMFLAIDAGFGVFSAGRLPTPLGYEVLEPWANANISRSRAWYYQPISHDGLALSGQLAGARWMAAVVNGMRISDNSFANNPDDEYGAIASVSLPIGNVETRLSAIYSDEQDEMRFFELNGYVAGHHDRWRYGLEGTWLDGNGHGGSGNPVVPPDLSVWDVTGYGGATFGNWSGDLRLSWTDQDATNGNYFNANHDGIVSFTATGGYEVIDGVVLRAEYRVDSSDTSIFDDNDSSSTMAGPVGQTDTVHVLQAQLLWAPATGRD